MKEKDLHNLIRENNSYDNKALADALKKRHPEVFRSAEEDNKAAPQKLSVKKRVAIFAPLATAAVAAVVLIPTLLLRTGAPDNSSDMGQSPAPPVRYATTELDCSVQEFNDRNNTNFLYFDLSGAADYTVTKYSSVGGEDFLGLKVSLTDPETNADVEYVVSSDADALDFLDRHVAICDNQSTVMGNAVKWGAQDDDSYGIFNFDGYGYYITLKGDPDETKLFDCIEELLLSRE